MSELPKGWVTVELSEVLLDVKAGFASGEKDTPNGVSHLRMNNIGLDGRLVLELVRTVPEELAKHHHDLIQGDVLVCTTNSGKLVGKCAFFDLAGRFAYSNHLTRLRPNSEISEGRFLNWNLWLAWRSGSYDEKVKHWVNQSALPKEALLQTEIVIPPLAEQRRIIGKLEALIGKVDGCRKRLDKIPAILKRFRQSVLAAACSGRLTADWLEADQAPWTNVTLRDLTTLITKGASPKWQGFSYVEAGDNATLFVTSENVREMHLDLSTPKYVETAFSQAQRRSLLLNGDLLTNIVGASIGRSAIFESDQLANINQAVCLIRLKESVDRRFILYSLSSPTTLEFFREEKVDVARANLSLEDIRNIPIECPTLPEQHEIVRRVEAMFAVADQIEARYAKATAHVDLLTKSILAKAFRGELVPHNQNEEPASVLLERIRAQRASAVAATPVKRKPRGGVVTPATRGPSTLTARRGRPPKAVPPTPALHRSTGKHSDVSLSRAALAILRRMKPGRDYARADLADTLGLSVAEWNSGINELKDAKFAMQTGERRGARYRKTVEPGVNP